ncbi:MAG: FAD-dependent oxidoreductase [Leucobacter sp.]
MTEQIWDAIVIGGGPAGLSAAQALGRSLRRTLVIDAGSPRNRFAARMHNLLGHDGLPPGELAARGRAEAEAYGVEFRAASVRRVRDGERWVEVELGGGGGAGGELLRARALVVATGLTDVLPEIPGLAEYWGRGVLHCPYCHGWEVRGQRIGVVAASPLGMHQVRLLRQWSDHVTAFTAALGEIEPAARRELTTRGIELVPSPVTEIVGDGDGIIAVRTADGAEHAVDAVFTMGAMVPQDGFLGELALKREDTPVGSFLAVDMMSRTSHPRIWAAGNVTNPGASVPMVAGAGTFAGAAVNAALVEEDFALAVSAEGEDPVEAAPDPAHRHQHGHQHGHGHPDDVDGDADPAEFWERRYADADRIWSGRVNRTLADAVAGLPAGRSLDLGCGEGGDVLWLAERGWEATGIDLSPTAVARAQAAAQDRGIPGERIRLIAADLAEWVVNPTAIDGGAAPFDLVTASFLQSPVELPRERILRAAAERVAPGGHLVLVSHAAPPEWAGDYDGPASFPTPEGELAALDLGADWETLAAEVRDREATGPDGEPAVLQDTVVVTRRLG